MKAIYAGLVGSVPLNTINNYLYNCNRKPYEISFHVPVIDASDVQIYIDFGAVKPVSFTSQIISLCDASNVVSPPCQYVFGVAPDGSYYGVFRFSNTTALPAVFAVVIDVTMTGGSVRRYFSQSYQLELSCQEPLKIEACFPENSNLLGYDTNGIYYGLTTNYANSAGNMVMRYLHFVNIRRAKVFEDSPKITFSANIRQNFKSVLNRIYELRTELVPNWYKEYLLAVYARGFIQVNKIIYQVTDLAFDGIDDDDHTWKPYAKLKQETRFYFGCDSQPCGSDCCSPCDVTATVEVIPEFCCTPDADVVHASAFTFPDNPGFQIRVFTDASDGKFTDVFVACAHLNTSGFTSGPVFYLSPSAIDPTTHEIINGSNCYSDEAATVPVPDSSSFVGFKIIINLETLTQTVVDFEGSIFASSIFPEPC